MVAVRAVAIRRVVTTQKKATVVGAVLDGLFGPRVVHASDGCEELYYTGYGPVARSRASKVRLRTECEDIEAAYYYESAWVDEQADTFEMSYYAEFDTTSGTEYSEVFFSYEGEAVVVNGGWEESQQKPVGSIVAGATCSASTPLDTWNGINCGNTDGLANIILGQAVDSATKASFLNVIGALAACSAATSPSAGIGTLVVCGGGAYFLLNSIGAVDDAFGLLVDYAMDCILDVWEEEEPKPASDHSIPDWSGLARRELGGARWTLASAY